MTLNIKEAAKKWPWFKTNGIPFWGVLCTTHLRDLF